MKKLFNKIKVKKIVAVFTAITFIFTGVFGNSAFASIGTSMPAINTINFDTPIIPVSLGKITSAKYFDSDDIIINIQDLHCHAETQRKIASIIGYIDNTYSLNNVYLEGAFKTVDTSWLSSFNNNKNGTKVLEGLIDSGKLSGTEYYSIINNKKNFVLGIEEEALYKENIKLLGSILSLQSDIDAICTQMETEIKKIKRDYSGKYARKLEKLIKSYKEKEIDAKYFYGQLKLLADNFKLSMDKYPNIQIYLSLLNKTHYVNNKKVVQEFTKFVSEIKNVLPYQQYTQLLKKSNNFNNLDDIAVDLIALDKQYSITQRLKLENLNNFLSYLNFNHNINPVKLVQEEEAFINELYVKAGRTKYEKEVSFLADFVNTIRQYFTADISADEYYKFEKNYNTFKTIWPSYFSENIIKNLDQYQRLLSKYHKNNILRDNVFADCLISKKNLDNTTFVADTNAAIQQIKSNINKKNLKLVVTGGFHTRGLERIFEKQKISYVIITPKITQPIEQAKQIYIDNVMYYSTILKNTINLEPLTQEPLNVSFPKILSLIFSEIQNNVIFEDYSKDELVQAVKQFIQEYIIAKQSGFFGEVEILSWDILSASLDGTIEFFVEYKDKANKSTISNIRYRFVDGQVIAYSTIDTARTKQMLERVTANKYAQPSVELEPTNATRKKIAKHILEPLQKVIGNAITLMPFEQLHMTIGYDFAPATQQEIDSLAQKADMNDEIFSVLDILGQDFVNFRTSMAGTLKLMPDGVIIYEITDKDLIQKMLGFRTALKDVDPKYRTPSIVHMSIGRITDMKLLDGSEQSNQQLAELLQKLNETIYEINKKNALSKIKTTFTLKSGYVSSTGHKDFVFRRVLPKKESLVVLQNVVDSSKNKLKFIYKVVIAPVIEEFAFRFVPFFAAGLFVSSPVSIVPVIVTGIVGILGFSFAHPLADKINNYFYNKNETDETKSGFIKDFFKEQLSVRNVRDFLFPSTVLTAVFVTASLVFPQATFAAFIITSLLHSLNNFIAVQKERGLLLTIKQDSSSQDKKLDSEIDKIIETLKRLTENSSLDYKKERNAFIEAFENIGEDKDAVAQKVIELFNFVVENHKKERGFSLDNFDFVLLFEPLLNISIYLRDEQGNLLFDKFFSSVMKEAADKKNGSIRYFEMLINSAQYFYKNGQIGFVHKIFDSLYKNKASVKSMTDYKKFAVPVPSPFAFDSVDEWETEITAIMKEDSAFAVWFFPILEVLLSSPSGKVDEYAKAYIRALYRSGKQTVPATLDSRKMSYEWVKDFYNACGIYDEYFNLEQSEILAEDKISKEKISLSNLISKLGYLKLQKKDIPYIQSDKFNSVIETLRNALSLSKKEQLKILQEQISILYGNLFENQKINSEILDVFAPVFGALVKEGTTTFLEDLCNKLLERGNTNSKLDFGFAEIAYVYTIDKEKALTLIKKKFKDSIHTYKPLYVELYGRNWKKFSPKTIEEARQNVPKELQKIIFEYKDLELFYNAIGISFDILEEQSQIFDREMYVPEYQPLFSFVPKIVLKFKNSTKYFRTFKTERIKSLEVNKEKLMTLDRLLKNGNLALAKISDSEKDLKQAIEIVEQMLKDLKLISSDSNFTDGLEKNLDYIKEQLEAGNIQDILGKEVVWWTKNRSIYTLISDINEKAISETKTISDKFDAFEKLLENNELALSSLTRMTEDSIGDTIYFIEEMLDSFEIIHPRFAQKAKISLLRIKKDIENGKVKIESLSKLNPWTEDKLDEINELHTLINAVHQTSTGKLMAMAESSSNIGGRETVLRQEGKNLFSFYDCSTDSIKDEMKEFLVTLSEITENSEGQCVIKDNKLVYSKQLGFHGVNILVDMEEGIRVTFNESGRGDGNALRTTLLATLFAQAGFDITYVDTLVTESSSVGGPCKFTAVYNLKNDFNAPEKYAFLFSQALEILSNTKDMDYALEDDNESENPHYYGKYYIPNLTVEDYRKMKNSFDMPEEFKRGKIGGLAAYWKGRIERVKQLRNVFEKSKQKERESLSTLYNYLEMGDDVASPWEVVSEYVKGKLIINENGLLVRNEQYDGINILLDAIEGDVDDLLRQAQVINLLDYDSLNYETEGYIGGMVALSGLLRLDGKGWLSVKTAVDKERKRAKFAYVEFVDFEGNRTKLDYQDLIKILKEFGYTVKAQKPRSFSEKEEALTVLREKILYPKDGIYTRGMSVSGQSDKYIPVKITYDKNNVDENSMWVVSFTSPEDVPSIIKAGAIMTTTGGMLSHANITARENKKTAILSNGQWIDGKLVVSYYSIESPIEQRRGYEIQKIAEHNLVLEEGDVVLANGINGRVLVYKNIPAISEIQKAIDDNNLDYIATYIQNHYEDSNIRQVVEYIFLQVITDKEKQKIAEFLLSLDQDNRDSDMSKKITELVQVYTGEKIKALKIYIENEKKIKDANIRLIVLNFIQQELEVLQYSLANDDIANERQKLLDIVRNDRNSVVAQRAEEVKRIIKPANDILSKSDMSEDDKDELIRISERAKVWGFYGSSQIKDLVTEIDKIISLETGKDYKTEIRDFEDIRAKDVVRYGTKTTELAKLFRLFIQKGIKIAKVPHGVGISKDVLRIFFEQNGQAEKYSQLIKDFEQAIKSKNKEKALEKGREISKFIESLDDKQLESYLKSKLEDGKKYAVRSSGVGEDGANHAFAGMAKTALNIDKDNVYAKVKEGWKSFFTDTCIEDMVKVGIVVQPALLIQEMVVGVQKAGVMFTRDNSGNLTIEGVLGLGEGLVSGRITPDHIIVRVADGRIDYRRALNNMIKIEEKSQGGTRVAKISAEEKIERILDEDTIRQLQKIADILEEDAGYPTDIEFAIDESGNIFVLQRRAITTFVQQEQIEEEPLQTVEGPVIEQAFIDKTIEMLSSLSMYDEIKTIVERLSNLPEDVTGKYNVVISQVKELIKFLKKNHKEHYDIQLGFENRYGQYESEDTPYGKLRKFCLEQGLVKSFDSNVSLSKVVVYILTSFLTLVDVNNSGKLLFYYIIDSLFVDDRYSDGRDRDKSVILSEMSKFIGLTYSTNPEFVAYIVNKMLEKNIIAIDENMPYELRSELMGKYDALKLFYYALSAKDKVNDNIAESLSENVKRLKNIVPLIEDEEIKQDVDTIVNHLDELIDKISINNVVLLEMQLNSLLSKVKKLNETNTNKEAAFEILDIVLSICDNVVKENKDLNAVNLKIYDSLYTLLIDEFNNNTDHTLFNNVVSKLLLLVQPRSNDKNIGNFKSFNEEIVNILLNIALRVYEPISSNKLEDKNSQEYQDREKFCLNVFRILALNRVTDTEIYRCLFNKGSNRVQGVGLTQETLDILINAAKQNQYVLSIPSTTDDFIHGDLDLLAGMVADSIEYIDPVSMFTSAFSKELNEYGDDDDWSFSSSRKEMKNKAKILSRLIMEKLFAVAGDDKVDLKKRKKAVVTLLEAVAKGLYKDNVKDVPIDFEQVKLLAEKLDVPVIIYAGDTYIKHVNGYAEYTFTPLIKLLPKSVLDRFAAPLLQSGRWSRSKDAFDLLKGKKPIITSVSGKTDATVTEVQQVLFRFEVLQKILQYNKSVLSLMDKIKDPKNYDKNMAELLKELQEMIDELKKINSEHGNAAQQALDNIKISLEDTSIDKKSQVRRHIVLSSWIKENIQDIKEIHTLINAVHQISIADFKREIGDIRKIGAPIQLITAHQESTIKGYNLSDTINSNIIKFLSKLSKRKVPNHVIDDFICKDDLIVWTTVLNAHSVDIFFNFGEADRGISIYYKETPDLSYERGKKERVRYFKDILEYLGFRVTIEEDNKSYSVNATLNKDYGMNEAMDLIDIAIHVIEIFKYSTNVDCDFETRHYESGFENVYKKWVDKAKRRELWYGVEVNNYGKAYGYGERGYKLDALPEKRRISAESLNEILSYLGCDLLPTTTTWEDITNPVYLDKYFNKPIERAFVEGRIKFNKDGVLERDREYDIVHSMINEINTNFTETSQQARIINLVNTYEFDTRILANIGSFVVVSSVMELKNGDKLFIKAIMDSNTKRMKYAIAEQVTNSTRQKLTSDELIKILGKEGYVIPQQEWVDSRERKRIKNMLSRQIQTVESPKIPSTPTSDGTGVSVVGNITFDKNNVDENSILVVPYTTPDDMRFIETAKGIITTGGGVLSHAAITTRELKKPSVVLNGATWTNKEIEILYYLASGEPETIGNQFQVQKVKATRKILKEGARVLVNGETGAVLLFDDIDISLLDELQSFIDTDNAQSVINFMNSHSKDKNINRLVEYVYFQVVGNSNTIQTLDCLFSNDMPEIVQNKVKELNDSYIQDKVQSISEAIANLKTISNVNIAYMVLQELNKKLAFIKTVGTRSEIEGLKEQLKYIEQEIKTKLNLYMQNFINDVVDLLSKDKLSAVDIQKIITMLKNVEIYNYFISDNETMKDLLSKKDTLQILVLMLRDKVNGYNEQQQEIMLQDEISLFEEKADNEKIFGSKTSQLAKMFKLLNGRKGVTVPGGIGISVNVMPMLFKSLEQGNLLTEFENAIKNKDKQRAMEIAKEICKLIDSEALKGTELEKEIIKQLKKFIKQGQNYSVRSSGVGEDATNNAFAGMGETKLNIGYDDIYDNVRECWKSFFAERCIDYMISSGQVVKPAVLVEEMVDSEISGVVFSRDKYGNGRINALFGQGEGLVSGMFTPDSILFDMSSHEIIEYSVADKQFKLVTDSEGGIKKVAVGQNAKSRALNAQNVKNLAEIIEILENSVGYPIDVEFAIRGNEIYILQMRPITTLDNKEKSTETAKGADAGVDEMQAIPFAETKYEISLTAGRIPKGQEVFVYISNPLDPTQAIPVYKKSADKNITDFVVDSKFASLVKNGLLGRALMLRINTDPVVLDKLNDGIFNYKLGEIGLLPILDEDELEKSVFDNSTEVGIENIRSILASA